MHIAAADTFPLPWDDELYYLLQARALVDNVTLYTSELLPDRPLMTKPPGWSVLLALWSIFCGYSLESARLLTFVFTLMSFYLLMKIIDRKNVYLKISLIIIFLSPQFVMTSNIGRMDTLILCLGLLSLVCVLSKRVLLALSISFLTLNFHYNGFFIVAANLFLFICFYRESKVTPSASVKIFFIFTFITLLLSSLWIGFHWQGFYVDFGYDFYKKIGRLNVFYSVVPIVICSFLFFMCLKVYRISERRLSLGVYSAALLSCYFIGKEPWYEIYALVGVFLLALICCEHFASSRNDFVAMLCILFFAFIPIIKNDFQYSFLGMKLSTSASYLSDSDSSYVRERLIGISEVCKEKMPLTVMFPFQGTALYHLKTIRDLEYKLKVDLKHSHLKSQYSDIKIMHLNKKHVPEWLLEKYDDINIEEGKNIAIYSKLKCAPSV